MKGNDEGYVGSVSDTMELISSTGEMNTNGCEEFCSSVFSNEQQAQDIICISSFGPSKSGKSLLLNRLFSTEFPVSKRYNSTIQNASTMIAKPTLLSNQISSRPIMVLDSGSKSSLIDSQESSTTARDLISCFMSFSLAISDVLVYNLWATDVGRYEAAGYDILRSIFTEYCRLFPRELNENQLEVSDLKKTALLLVLHDHDDGSSLNLMRETLVSDLEKLWNDVPKSVGSGYATNPVKLIEVFEISVTSLPHPKHRKAEFDLKIDALRDRFVESDLLKSDYSKAVPLEAFPTYVDVVWQDVCGARGSVGQNGTTSAGVFGVSRKDLVASYVCDNAYNSQYKSVMRTFNSWNSGVDRGRVIGRFGHSAERLLARVKREYEALTQSQSEQSVRGEKLDLLETLCASQIRTLFNKQLVILQNQSVQKLKRALVSRASSNDHLVSLDSDALIREAERCEQWFIDAADRLLIPSMPALGYGSARAEVHSVLRDFATKFAESPTVQLQAMKRIQREANRPPKKAGASLLGVNLSITGACRPAGTGNFQVVSSYAKHGHRANFVICNDADLAEQSGEGPVPLFRFQPALNFDLNP